MAQSGAEVVALRLSALGDCINAFGVLCALRDEGVRISWLLDGRFAPLFRDEGGRPLVPLVEADFSRGFARAWLGVRQAFRGRKVAVLLNMQTSLRASLLSLALPCPRRIGYDAPRSREGQRLFVNETIAAPASPHVLSGYLAFAAALGFPGLTPRWDFALDPGRRSEARSRLGAPGQGIMAIAPCSAKAQKNWTVEGYAAVARHALGRGMGVALLGGRAPAELELCQGINDALGGAALNLCGKTSLRELAYVVSCVDLLLAPDSATMHLASALGRPVVGLFAVHDPNRVGAYNYRHLEVSAYERCASAELGDRPRPWRYRVRDPHAMGRIGIPEAIAMVDRALCGNTGASHD
ncbi:MAG: glycosyltransferase family 9 protein [Succinivibrionaceae bacterium]|nr:glycosyltransferase family 9 protein [Succinivibrionaceae bacterium]